MKPLKGTEVKNNKIELFGKEYREEDLSDDQKQCIHQINDLHVKLQRAQFEVQQYEFCKGSFLAYLEEMMTEDEIVEE